MFDQSTSSSAFVGLGRTPAATVAQPSLSLLLLLLLLVLARCSSTSPSSGHGDPQCPLAPIIPRDLSDHGRCLLTAA